MPLLSATRRPRAARLHRCRQAAGFTLIEMMIVVAIIGILAAVAYPFYAKQVVRGKRADGTTGLLKAAQYMQRYYAAQNGFGNLADTLPSAYATVPSSGTQTYTISVKSPSASGRAASTYLLTATPSFTDSDCGKLTLDDTGTKGVQNGTVADCWR